MRKSCIIQKPVIVVNQAYFDNRFNQKLRKERSADWERFLQEIISHEFGHSLGIRHPEAANVPQCNNTVMTDTTTTTAELKYPDPCHSKIDACLVRMISDKPLDCKPVSRGDVDSLFRSATYKDPAKELETCGMTLQEKTDHWAHPPQEHDQGVDITPLPVSAPVNPHKAKTHRTPRQSK